MASGTPRSGLNGVVMIDASSAGGTNATTQTSVASWTFDMSRDFADTTCMGDQTKSGVPLLANATGSFEGPWDSADSNRYNILGATVQRELKIYPDIVNNATTYVYGRAFFSGSFSGGVTDAVKGNFTFTAGGYGLYWAHP